MYTVWPDHSHYQTSFTFWKRYSPASSAVCRLCSMFQVPLSWTNTCAGMGFNCAAISESFLFLWMISYPYSNKCIGPPNWTLVAFLFRLITIVYLGFIDIFHVFSRIVSLNSTWCIHIQQFYEADSCDCLFDYKSKQFYIED